MSTEAKFRKALETVGTLPCSCSNHGTCAACIAIKALIPDGLNATTDQGVTISIDGQDDEPTTIIRLGRVDNKFPLVTDDPSQGTNELILRVLSLLVETVKDSTAFAAAIAKTGFRVDIWQEQ